MREPKLTRFLLRLTTTDKLRKRFAKNPDKVMRDEGLSAAQRRVILSRDGRKIAKAIAAELPRGATQITYFGVLSFGPPMMVFIVPLAVRD